MNKTLLTAEKATPNAPFFGSTMPNCANCPERICCSDGHDFDPTDTAIDTYHNCGITADFEDLTHDHYAGFEDYKPERIYTYPELREEEENSCFNTIYALTGTDRDLSILHSANAFEFYERLPFDYGNGYPLYRCTDTNYLYVLTSYSYTTYIATLSKLNPYDQRVE